MTTKQAIQLLHRLQDEQFDGIHGDERREALSMAVMALSSQQTDTDSQGLVNDCISRQAAIIVFENSGLDDDSKDTAVRVLEQLPSAQPEIYKEKLKEIADALSEKFAYMNTCLNERDIILGYLGVKRPSKIHCDTDCTNIKCESYRCNKRLTSAQPERKKGKWIFHETENDRYDDMICPFCKTTYTVDAYRIDDIGFTAEDFNYCPNCGARME